VIIPYGGEIDYSLEINNELLKKYPFLGEEYFLSISRSLKDNLIDELCEFFVGLNQKLVLVSNLSCSDYGKRIIKKYGNLTNIVLIDGLYVKPELDLIRRNCKGYIHTHTLCGTAPSLVEMIIARKPIVSIDRPQNRFTLRNNGLFFSDFKEILEVVTKDNLNDLVPPLELCESYNWHTIIREYQGLFK
jgi:glycosyltransferase involved in cell wall biosynthesis